MNINRLCATFCLIMMGGSVSAQSGKVGINTNNPYSPLHVKRNTGSGGPYFNFSLATFESDDQSYIHLSHPNTAESGILSGNQSALIRSGLVFGKDSSLVFRSGGNVTKMLLDKGGRLGLNTLAPKSLLHIRRSGDSGGPVHPNAYATFESNANGYLQFSNTNTSEAGILSGNQTGTIRSAIIFRADESIALRTGGNFDRLNIDPEGQVGIGTDNPSATLDIHGTMKLGANGTPVHEIIHVTKTVEITLIDPWQSRLEYTAVPNAIPGSGVYISPDTSLPNGILIAHARVSSFGTVEIKFFNATNNTIDPSARDFHISVVR